MTVQSSGNNPSNSSSQNANPSATKSPKIIIIGGLSAGPSAAAKARREDEFAEIILFEKSQYISYATCGIPYAMSGVIESREKLLVVRPELMRERFQIDLRLNEEIIEINTTEKWVKSHLGTYSYDKLIFAAGATPIVPPLEGLKETLNWSGIRTLEDYDRVQANGLLKKAKKVTILGAGLIGVELAENLVECGYEVTIVEGATTVLPIFDDEFGTLAAKTLQKHNIQVYTGQFAKSIQISDQKITAIQVGETTIETDFLFVSIGVRPNTQLLKGQVDMIGNGAIIVNSSMQTSLPDVFAAGDCVSIANLQTQEPAYLPLGTHSNKGGRTAGANAVLGQNTQTGEFSQSFAGAYGTAIIKIFDFTLARTGMNERTLKQKNIDYAVSFIYAGATPGYYPGAKENTIKLLYCPKTGRVLGAELWGEVGIDKRVDVISTAIYAKLTIHDLTQLDLAYAPPYSPAKDPVIVAAFNAQNQFKNNLSADLEIDKSAQLLDVRTEAEVKNGTLDNAQWIPLDNLRNRLSELDKSKPIQVYCQKGLRGYLANRILKAHGFTVSNLQGGYQKQINSQK